MIERDGWWAARSAMIDATFSATWLPSTSATMFITQLRGCECSSSPASPCASLADRLPSWTTISAIVVFCACHSRLRTRSGARARVLSMRTPAAVHAKFQFLLRELGAMPLAVLPLEQLVGRFRPPRPGGVCLQRRPAFPPGALDGVDQAPGGLHLVGAREERRVAQERVHDQALVGVGGVEQERRHVEEVHVHAPDPDAGRRHLGAETQGDALLGLDAERDRVRLQVAGRLAAEGEMRWPLDLDADLRHPLGQPFAG